VILYEYPLHERIRTYLRLGHLFLRLSQLVARLEPIDHHYALATIFEIMEVIALRSELKSDLLKDIDKQKHILEGYRGNPEIAESVLNDVIGQFNHCFEALNRQTGKSGKNLSDNDWLMSIRSRINIPGGTCEFDLPSYHAWQHQSSATRQADLQQWCSTLSPLADAVQVLLKLWRDSGTPQKVIAHDGKFQQHMPHGRTFLFVRLGFEAPQEIVPEISGNRLMVSVRLMRYGEDHRLVPATEDVPFDLSLCA
jgi:cell division protein ZapD